MAGEMKTEISRVTARSAAQLRAAGKGAVWLLIDQHSTPQQLQDARGVLEMLGLAEPRPAGRWVYHRKHGRHVWEEA